MDGAAAASGVSATGATAAGARVTIPDVLASISNDNAPRFARPIVLGHFGDADRDLNEVHWT
jgi:hypothetical protein